MKTNPLPIMAIITAKFSLCFLLIGIALAESTKEVMMIIVATGLMAIGIFFIIVATIIASEPEVSTEERALAKKKARIGLIILCGLVIASVFIRGDILLINNLSRLLISTTILIFFALAPP